MFADIKAITAPFSSAAAEFSALVGNEGDSLRWKPDADIFDAYDTGYFLTPMSLELYRAAEHCER